LNTANPASKVKNLNVDNERERFLTKDELTMILDEVRDNEQLYIFTLLSITTGGRIGAINALQKKDIDLKNKIVNIKDEKNNETYKAFIEHKALLELLATRLKTLKANDYVLMFDKKDYKQIIERRMRTILNKLFNKDIEPSDRKNRVVVHTLRHTFASQLAINGTPIFTIQKLMNHKDIKMTMRYAKLAPDSGRDAVKSIFEILA